VQVRDQQIRSMQNSGLGPREILHECTDWPTSTRMTSVLNHNADQPGSFTMRGSTYTISAFEPDESLWFGDVGVRSIERGEELDLHLSYAVDRISESFAAELLDAFSETLEQVMSLSSS
jgi:hypothetical protein